MSKWIWGLLIVVAICVVGYYTGVIKFHGHVDIHEGKKVLYQAGTPAKK